ncbi:MAG: menaquinone biosynthetic enzyme MqnA/MqnD family protein [Bacteroidales bacterium]
MRVNIAAVEYLNTTPFIYGLRHSKINDYLSLNLSIPSVCADLLKAQQVDVALVPAATIPLFSSCKIITDYCIGATAPVASVSLFAHQPLSDLHTIYLDNHSRTSSRLIQILAKEYWDINPQFKQFEYCAENEVNKSGVGCLLIGDKTFGLHAKYPYVYDLAEAWLAFTGKPFVFAVWLANNTVDGATIQLLNEAFEIGIQRVGDVIEEQKERYPKVDVRTYLTQNISYNFDESKKEGLNLFLEKIKDSTIV